MFWLTSCTNEFLEYHESQINKIQSESKIQAELKKFKVGKIEERDLEVVSSPDKQIIDKIVEKINKAKNKIYLETYIFSEKRILKATLDAKKRWIDVRVILEKNVLWNPSINSKTYESLIKSWILVKYSNPMNYKFTHSKFFLIDEEYIIQTWNISYSTYTSNKEFFVFGNNKKDFKNLEEIFNKDLIWEKYFFCDQTLIISPTCPRNEILKTLSSAKNNIYIYNQSLEDLEIIDLLLKKQKSWVKVSLLIWDINIVKSNKVVMEKLKKSGIAVKAPKKPYIHAKAFMVDENYIFYWSINFTNNSIENNREVGILFTNKKISSYFKNEFERLFNNVQ